MTYVIKIIIMNYKLLNYYKFIRDLIKNMNN